MQTTVATYIYINIYGGLDPAAPDHTSHSMGSHPVVPSVSANSLGPVTTWLRLVSRPGELFEQPVSGGAVRYSGPQRVSARALGRLCLEAGLHYTLVPRETATDATVEVGAPIAWSAPPPLTSAASRDVIAYLHKNFSGARVDVVPAAVTGATRVVRLKPAGDELRVPSTVVDIMLKAPGVLDVVLSPTSLAVTVAAPSDKIGSLSYLSHTGIIAPRVTRITPYTRSAVAGKKRRFKRTQNDGPLQKKLFARRRREGTRSRA